MYFITTIFFSKAVEAQIDTVTQGVNVAHIFYVMNAFFDEFCFEYFEFLSE